jgi:hypothetical protein
VCVVLARPSEIVLLIKMREMSGGELLVITADSRDRNLRVHKVATTARIHLSGEM